jgi:tRNA modification GTPase
LIEAQQSAQQALQALDNQLSNDLLAEDLKMVNEKLAVVTGEVLSTEVLNEIFSKFCIGK